MLKRIPLLVPLVVVGLLFVNIAQAQDKPEMSLEQLQAIAIEPAKMNPETNSRVVPEMLPLFKEEQITYTSDTKYKETVLKFRLHVPENMEPGKTYPLILWLHGVGEVGEDNQDQLVHLHHIITYLTGPQKREFFLLVPQAPNDHAGWDAYSYTRMIQKSPVASLVNKILGGNQEPAQMQMIEEGENFSDSPLAFSLDMVKQAMEKYPVDPNRITVSGLSSGGDGTWRALERAPDFFAAAVPLVSWSALKAEAIEKHPELKKIPIWAIYSSDDSGIEEARNDFARVEEAGCNVKKSEFGLCGHNAWTPAMLQADIFSWLLSRAKVDGEYVAVADSNVDPNEMQGIVEVAVRDDRKPTLALSADAAIETALKTPDSPASPPIAVPVATTQSHNDVTVMTPGQPAQTFAMGMGMNPGQSMSGMGGSDMFITTNAPAPSQQEGLRITLAARYFYGGHLADAKRIYNQLSPQGKIDFIQQVVEHTDDLRSLKFLEALIGEFPEYGTPQASFPMPATTFSTQVIIQQEEDFNVATEPASSRRVVEECEKEWEMSSTTLYGLYAADWNQEANLVPDYVKNMTTKELPQKLGDVLTGLDEGFEALCDSVLKLENQPMSSPWFKTSGGRLKSDIKYELSAKGEILRVVFYLYHDRPLPNGRQEAMQKVLDKMTVILEQ